MNKYQEAIEVEKLKHAISSIKTYMSYPNGKLCPTAEIAIEAIEKQIPKKPIKVSYDNLPVKPLTDVYSCPNCQGPLVRHCCCHNNNCRQAIDWSEVE